MKQNVVAFGIGFTLFIAASLTSLLLLLADKSTNIAMIMWPGLILAGAVITFLARSFRFVLALALAVPSAAAFGLQNVGWALINGQVEISLVEDFLLAVIMTLPYCLALCVVGGVCGMAVHMLREHPSLARLKPVLSKLEHPSRQHIKLLAKS